MFFKSLVRSYFFCFPVFIFVSLLVLTGLFYQHYPWYDILFGGIFIASFCAAREFLSRKWYFCISAFYFFITFLSAIICMYYLKFNRVYSLCDLAVICDGTFYEWFDFISDSLLYPVYIYAAAVIILYYLHEYIYFKYVKPFKLHPQIDFKVVQHKKMLIVILLISLIAMVAKGNIVGLRFPRQLFKEYITIRAQYSLKRQLFQKERILINKFLHGKISVIKKTPTTAILIIGESATSERMHCYGYSEPNTPFFSGANLDKMVLLKQCYSLNTLTSKVIPKLLSNQDYTCGSPNNVLIYDICKYLGINTYIISNQVGDSSHFFLKSAADHVFFPYKRKSRIESMLDYITPPDEIVIPTFKKVIDELNPQESNLIVVHLFGSHFPFANRLPANYNTKLSCGKLSKVEFEYLKTIEYTDRIISQFVQIAEEKLKNPFMFCYVSDHGEDAERKFSRSTPEISGNISAFFKIPCVFYFSDEFKNIYSQKVECLKENREKPFVNEHIFDMLVNCFNIETTDNQITSPHKNIFSKEYKQDTSNLKIIDYSYPLQLIINKNQP